MPTFNSRSIDAFKAKLKGGGARSNLFEVGFGNGAGDQLGLPSGEFFNEVSGGNTFDEGDLMLIKSAGLPASTISEIPVPFRGRTLKIAGDRVFDVWTITIINDTDFKWRSFFERWMNLITKVSDGSGTIAPAAYMTDMTVAQLTRGPTVSPDQVNNQNIDILRRYVVHGAFPTNVSQIDLSYNNENEIEEFTVDLQIQWWEAVNGNNNGPNGTGVI
jgi:hypothetical protein